MLQQALTLTQHGAFRSVTFHNSRQYNQGHPPVYKSQLLRKPFITIFTTVYNKTKWCWFHHDFQPPGRWV